MEDFKMSFKGTNNDLKCDLCSKHDDSQEESMKCPKLTLEGDDEEDNLRKYMKIFEDRIPIEAVEAVTSIIKKREKLK